VASVRIRHLVEKRRKSGGSLWYWQPSAALRKHGFQPKRLADTKAAAIAEAEALNQKVDAWRRGEERVQVAPQSLPWLIRMYVTDPHFAELAPKTRRGYQQCLRKIEDWSARAGHPPIQSIKRRHVRLFQSSMMDTPAMANATIRVLRLLLQHAVDEEFLEANPAAKPKLKGQPPRREFWRDEQIERFVQAAAEDGRPSLGLAVLLGANLGQREGDILRLSWSQGDGQSFSIKQGKTRATVRVPTTEQLREALQATPPQSPTIVISEATGRPYKADHFRHEFRRIANLAGIPKALQFLDLRRTAVVRLAEAGCTVPEIGAVTGHSIDDTEKIIETYMPRTTPMAKAAIRKLELHRKGTKSES